MYAPLPALHVLTRIFSRVVRNEHRRSSQVSRTSHVESSCTNAPNQQSDQISMKPHVRKEAAHTISTLNVVEDPWAVVFVCTDLCPGDRQLDAMQTTTDYVSIWSVATYKPRIRSVELIHDHSEDVSSVGMVQLPALGNAETACLDDIPVVLKQQRRRAMNALHVSSVPCTATGEDHLDIGSPTSPGELEGAETQAHISQASVRLVFRAFVHLATHSDDIIAKGTPLLKHDGIAKGLRFAHPKLGPTGVVLRILEPLSANAADDNSDPSLSENFSRSSSLATTRTTTDEDFTERLADDGLDRKIDEEDPVNRTSDIMLMGRFQYRGSEQSATPVSLCFHLFLGEPLDVYPLDFEERKTKDRRRHSRTSAILRNFGRRSAPRSTHTLSRYPIHPHCSPHATEQVVIGRNTEGSRPCASEGVFL